MAVTIIVRKHSGWAPTFSMATLKPAKGQKGKTILIPIGVSEKSEVKDIVAKVNAVHGRHYDEGHLEAQIENAIRGNPKPSMKRKLKTGYWSERDQREKRKGH